MKCPNCERRFYLGDFIFRMLPWYVKCKSCGSKFTLANQKAFWLHLLIFIAVAFLTYTGCHVINVWGVVPWLVLLELTVFIWIICEKVESTHGLKEIALFRKSDPA